MHPWIAKAVILAANIAMVVIRHRTGIGALGARRQESQGHA